MDDETWFNAQEAKEKGFVDEIMFEDEKIDLVASSYSDMMIPRQVIDKIRNMKEFKKEEEPAENKSDFLMAKLSLLKLKGDIK